MARVATFCPACGESFEIEVGDTQRAAGRAEAACPACGHEFHIRPRGETGGAAPEPCPPRDAAKPAAPSPPPAASEPESPPATFRPGPTPPAPPREQPEGRPQVPPGGWTATYDYPQRGPRKTAKPTVAGVLLITAALLGLIFGGFLAFLGEIAELTAEQAQGPADLGGEVVDADGDPLEGVAVAVVDTNVTATTNAQGRYRLEDVPAGIQTLRFNLSGYKTHEVRTIVAQNVGEFPVDVRMEQGAGTTRDDLLGGTLTRVCGGILFLLAAFGIVGAVSAFRRKNWGLAIAGGVTATLSFGFLLGALAGLIALILLAGSKKEFETAQTTSPS